jgi:hypothetical protein
MNSRRNFLQKLVASAIAFPLIPAEAGTLNEKIDEPLYDGPPLWDWEVMAPGWGKP